MCKTRAIAGVRLNLAKWQVCSSTVFRIVRLCLDEERVSHHRTFTCGVVFLKRLLPVVWPHRRPLRLFCHRYSPITNRRRRPLRRRSPCFYIRHAARPFRFRFLFIAMMRTLM